jgi:hypothetical protein
VSTSVPAGPLAVRWLTHDVPEMRAGARSVVTAEVENAGRVAWHGDTDGAINVSYHWLDLRGNAIVWAGIFTPLPEPVAPGEKATLRFPVEAPIPPGRYRLSLDLVADGRAWFAELGNEPVELDVAVTPRISALSLAVHVEEGPPELIAETRAALARQEEPVQTAGDAEATAFVAPGCRPAPDWSRRILDAHAEGYAAVGGSIAVEGGRIALRGVGRELEPWQPGFGRSPGWTEPLLCPSVLTEALTVAPFGEPICGLPALEPSRWNEHWLCDGRISVAVAARALKRAARRSG